MTFITLSLFALGIAKAGYNHAHTAVLPSKNQAGTQLAQGATTADKATQGQDKEEVAEFTTEDMLAQVNIPLAFPE